MKARSVLSFFEIVILVMIVAAIGGNGQPVPDTVHFLGDTSMINQGSVRVPVILTNLGRVGAFNVVVWTSMPGFINGIAADTIGTRLQFAIDTIYQIVYDPFGNPIDTLEIIDTTYTWQYFYNGPGADTLFPDSFYVTGLVDDPLVPGHPGPLDPGSGPIFNLRFGLPCGCDVTYLDTFVEMRFARVHISDPYGSLNPVYYYDALLWVHIDANEILRGDANLNGTRSGADVTTMVAYFKGQTDCIRILKAGDANVDGRISGGDITYLVRYFKGLGPPPPP